MQIDTLLVAFPLRKLALSDMRMDPSNQTLTAAEIINTYNAADLAQVIRQYSDEKWASRIAEFVVAARKEKPLPTSEELVEVIKAAVPASARRAGGHPMERTFQALRIEVNGELDCVAQWLRGSYSLAGPGGHIAVISYHSLEDRIVKDLFKKMSTGCTCPPDLPICVCGNKPVLKVLRETDSAVSPMK